MRGNRLRFYIAPLVAPFTFGPYIEVSDDVDMRSLGAIAQNLDNTDYNIGIYRTANLGVTLRNDNGQYSDVGQATSIFTYRRGGSKVKITWQQEQDGFKCGFFVCGEMSCGPEVDIFNGILNDDSLVLSLDNQLLSFTLLGLESILSTVSVPFGDLTVNGQPTPTISIASPAVITATAHGLAIGNPIQFSTTGNLPEGITAGATYYVQSVIDADNYTIATSFGGAAVNTSGSQSGSHFYVLLFGLLMSDVIKTILNQVGITYAVDFLAANINLGLDLVMDDISTLQNTDVLSAMKQLLLLSNSVFYISGTAIVVAPRTPTAAIKQTFYGQSSILGPEDIQNIQNVKNGLNQIFNYFSWSPSNVTIQDSTSVDKYGLNQKKFDQINFTDVAKQTAILDSLLDEFSQPRQSFELFTPLSYKLLSRLLLDKIAVDYPLVYLPDGADLPICGTAICGVAQIPNAIWSFSESPLNPYKLIGVSIDPKTWLVKLLLRKI